jgi:hypothetical protein
MAVYPRLNRLGPQGSVLQLLAAQHLGPEHPLASVPAAENMAQPTGSLADDGRPDSSVLLGTGMGPARFGRAPSQFQRSVVRRGGRLMEAHSYGPGTETRYFERKNPAVLQAAAAQAAQQQVGAPVQAAQGLDPRDQELLKLLLGNPSLRR